MLAQAPIQPSLRETWIDILKIIACFGMILAHSASYTYGHTGLFVSLSLNSLARFGVPCFMIINAMLIFQKQDSVNKIVLQRLPRFLLLLIFWSLVFILYKILKGTDLNFINEVYTIPFQHKYSHLWYIYYIIQLYIVSPIFVIFMRYSDNAQQLLVISIFLGKKFLDMVLIMFNVPGSIYVVTGWNKLAIEEFLFAILSIYVYNLANSGKIKRSTAIIGILAGYSLMLFGSWHMSILTLKPWEIFFSHMSFQSMLFGLSIFALFCSFKDYFSNINDKIKQKITRISKLTMGIYFIHPIIQELLFSSTRWSFSRPLVSLLFVFCIFVVSLASCYILSKVVFLRKMVNM
jgi:surface polysaccharide O-acyltransferase-like enzyme